jgi:hypothetical protein
VNARIGNLISLGRLVEEEACDEEVSGLWSHAGEAYEDGALTNRSPNRRLTSAYDAGRIAALAVVRAANLRVRAQNHHEVTLAAAGLLAGEPLQTLFQEFQGLRLERIQIEYGWNTRATVADVDRVLPKVLAILEHGSRWIRSQRPAVELPPTA